MKESDLWGYIRKGMKPYWQATRIENTTGNGVPDVTYTIVKHGWIELKYIPKWPVRGPTIVKLPLRPEQKLWIESRGKLARYVWVICRIEDDFFLLNHNQAVESYEGWRREEWIERSQIHWHKKIDFLQLASEIR